MQLVSVKSKERKRVGRGLSAGQGKTAGRGYKGQKSRSGFNIPRKFEGGQTPLSMRLPVLPGFKSHKKKASIISLDTISSFYKDGEIVSLETLIAKNIVKKGERAKILNDGKLLVAVKLAEDVKVSESVREVFESAKPAKVEKPVAAEAPKIALEAKPKAKPAAKKPAAKKTAKAE